MVRLTGGTDYRYIIPGSALLGMAVVTWCDTVSRIILAPVELPSRHHHAFLGAPFFSVPAEEGTVMDTPQAVSLNHISVTLGDTPVLHDISLSVAPGEFLSIIGPNGVWQKHAQSSAI